MTIIRKFVAGGVGVVAMLLALVAVIYVAPWNNGIDHTIQNAREIEKSFNEASVFIEDFKKVQNRLPSETEFHAWAVTQPEQVHSARYIEFITSSSQVPQEVIKQFGAPSPGAYVLQYWRGEWFEYFASWAKASTLELDASSFYVLGSAVADGIVLLLISVLVGAIARVIWPRPIQS